MATVQKELTVSVIPIPALYPARQLWVGLLLRVGFWGDIKIYVWDIFTYPADLCLSYLFATYHSKERYPASLGLSLASGRHQ